VSCEPLLELVLLVLFQVEPLDEVVVLQEREPPDDDEEEDDDVDER
jgi:hypothetical protein